MLSQERIEENKKEIIEKLKSISREGSNIDKLVDWLEKHEFFSSPASTKYHLATAGGLAEHSLNVFYNLMHLIKYKQLEDKISEESAIIVALLHDISKAGNYEVTSRNFKLYTPDGSKKDEVGTFEWKSEKSYKIKDDTFVFGSHEMNSEYMVSHFIPLTVEESVAILHHMGSMSWDSAKDDIGKVFTKYPLSLLLWEADCLSTYIDEKLVE